MKMNQMKFSCLGKMHDFDLASAEQSIGVTLNPPVEPGLEFGVQRHVDFDLLQF